MRHVPVLILLSLFLSSALADGPEDNDPKTVRQVPPPGIEVTPEQRAEIQAGLDTLQGKIETIRANESLSPALLSYLPDVEVFHKAVRDALRHDEFFKPAEIHFALDHLKLGMERADQLNRGETP